jgi:hypothetical protein
VGPLGLTGSESDGRADKQWRTLVIDWRSFQGDWRSFQGPLPAPGIAVEGPAMKSRSLGRRWQRRVAGPPYSVRLAGVRARLVGSDARAPHDSGRTSPMRGMRRTCGVSRPSARVRSARFSRGALRGRVGAVLALSWPLHGVRLPAVRRCAGVAVPGRAYHYAVLRGLVPIPVDRGVSRGDREEGVRVLLLVTTLLGLASPGSRRQPGRDR